MPILRINPDEVHIEDTAFFGLVFASNSAEPIRAEYRMDCTASAELHSIPSLQKAAVSRTRPFMIDRAARLIRLMQEHEGPVALNDAFWAMTEDFIARHSFDEDLNLIEGKDYSPHCYRIFMGGIMYHKRHAIPWYSAALNKLPASILVCLEPAYLHMMEFTKVSISSNRPVLMAQLIASDRS